MNINFCECLHSTQRGRDCSENALLPESACNQIQQYERDNPIHMLPLDDLAKQERIKVLVVVSKIIKCWDSGPSRIDCWRAMDTAVEDMVMKWD